MSVFERIRRFFQRQSDASRDTHADRIDAQTAARAFDHPGRSDGGAIPPNYLPTGVDEGRPKK
jgi:hypothetical protein